MTHHVRAILVALLFCSAAAHAHDRKPPEPAPPTAPPLAPFVDTWGGWRAHVGVSAVLGAAGILAFPDRPVAVFAGCMLPGLVREIRQSRDPGNGFSRRDIAANAFGCLAGEVGGGLIGAAIDANGTHWLTWSRGF